MPDDRFHRADCAVLRDLSVPRHAPARERLGQAGDFDGVSELGAGAMGLDIAHGACLDVRSLERRLHQLALRNRVGNGVPLSAPAVIDAAPADDAVDVISISDGATQRLEHDDSNSLARYEAIAPGAEGPAASIPRQHALSTQCDVARRVQIQVHSTGDRHLALAPEQVLASLVYRSQRSRAHRVYRYAGSTQIEHVRHAVRNGAEARVRMSAFAPLPQLRTIEIEP